LCCSRRKFQQSYRLENKTIRSTRNRDRINGFKMSIERNIMRFQTKTNEHPIVNTLWTQMTLFPFICLQICKCDILILSIPLSTTSFYLHLSTFWIHHVSFRRQFSKVVLCYLYLSTYWVHHVSFHHQFSKVVYRCCID
jgi:hypothetical protein